MEQVKKHQENKMGVMPVKKLLLSMALPMIISMLVQAMYNVIDSIFVAQISEGALTAVSLAFPVQNLMIAVASGTGVGINALLSRSLGEKNFKQVNLAAGNGVFLIFVSFIAFCLFGLFGTKAFFMSQTNDPEILEYSIQYLSICLTLSFGFFMQMVFERLLQSTGKTLFTMITQGTGAIINIILDPILIFGLFGFPKMGVAGAALATVIGQWVGMLLAIYFNLRKNHEIKFKVEYLRPRKEVVKGIYSVGVPSIVMMAITSVMTFGFNQILLMFSSTATAVFGVYFKLQSFVFMPVIGLNNGMVPIVAYNYGARHKKRITDTIRISIISAVTMMLIGLAAFQIFPAQLLGMFNASEEMIQMGVPALKAISLSFLFAGFCIIVGSVFQALGRGMLSLMVSVARQLIVILPVAFIFAKLFGLNAVWYSFPIAELASVTLSVIFFRHIYNDKIKNLEQE